MLLDPAIGLDDLFGKSGRSQDLRDESVWVKSDWGDELLQLLGRLLGVRRRIARLGGRILGRRLLVILSG